MDTLFEFLFNYPPALFRRGELVLAGGWPLYALAVAAALALSAWLYSRATPASPSRTLRGRDRALLTLLRAGALATLLFSLWQPALLLSTTAPGRGFLGLLLDDSLSMSIADDEGGAGGGPRGRRMQQAFDPAGGERFRELAGRFDVRAFRFGGAGGLRPLNAPGTEGAGDGAGAAPAFAGGSTDLAGALRAARLAFAGAPLAGLVLVSDGAANVDPVADAVSGAVADGASPSADLDRVLLELRTARVPVYTVGVGRERFRRDLEITQLTLPDRLLSGSAAQAEITLRHTGFQPGEVPLQIEDGGAILHRQAVALGAGEGSVTLRVPLSFDEPGLRRLRVAVPPQPGETLTENNHRDALLDVYAAEQRILYLEGEPRFELKFIRRALSDDANVDVVTLLRTAENKFYRVGIDSPEELADGFPGDREGLFRYQGLILGSVEAAFFTPEQQRLIVDFVGERGGGLLLLGGKRSFAEGGYRDTPLADVMPVRLGAGAAAGFIADVALTPTDAGRLHPLLALRTVGAGDGGSAADADAPSLPVTAWSDLPPLTVVNPISEAKPGATVLLSGRQQGGGEPLLALTQQRYGRGQVLAFPVQNSWLWQMHPDIALDDQTHETLWRRLARWLVNDVPGRLQVSVSETAVTPGESVAVTARVLDAAYRGVDGAAPEALLISPTGVERTLALTPTRRQVGEYRADMVVDESGLYELQVRAAPGAGAALSANAGAGAGQGGADTDLSTPARTAPFDLAAIPPTTRYLRAEPGAREFYRAEQQRALLQRVADETGGAYYPLAASAALADDIRHAPGGASVTERLELWNMPALLLALLTLLGIEWFYRRWRGLR